MFRRPKVQIKPKIKGAPLLRTPAVKTNVEIGKEIQVPKEAPLPPTLLVNDTHREKERVAENVDTEYSPNPIKIIPKSPPLAIEQSAVIPLRSPSPRKGLRPTTTIELADPTEGSEAGESITQDNLNFDGDESTSLDKTIGQIIHPASKINLAVKSSKIVPIIGDNEELDEDFYEPVIRLRKGPKNRKTIDKNFKAPGKRQLKPKAKFDGPLDRNKVTMFDLLSYNPPREEVDEIDLEDEEMVVNGFNKALPAKESDVKDAEKKPLDEMPKKSASDEVEEIGPRVKVGLNGEIIIDEESLIVKRKKEVVGKVVYENRETTTYSSFRKQKSTGTKPRWTEKETVKFYTALSLVGTDFTLMSNCFFKETRSREDLRNKFKKEDRCHKQLIDKAMTNSNLSNLATLNSKLDDLLASDAGTDSDEESVPVPIKKRAKKEKGSEKRIDLPKLTKSKDNVT